MLLLFIGKYKKKEDVLILSLDKSCEFKPIIMFPNRKKKKKMFNFSLVKMFPSGVVNQTTLTSPAAYEAPEHVGCTGQRNRPGPPQSQSGSACG